MFQPIRGGRWQRKREATGHNPAMTAKKFPLHPPHPERICWGCDKYCAAPLGCGGGSERTQHPVELFGDDWFLHGDWGMDIGDAAPLPDKK